MHDRLSQALFLPNSSARIGTPRLPACTTETGWLFNIDFKVGNGILH